MRHQKQGRAALSVEREQKVGDGAAIVAVQIAGGLVGEQDLRARRKRPGQRHALLFAARQLSGIMGAPIGQPHRFQLGGGQVPGIGHAAQFQRHRDIFQGRHGGDQMKGLEHDADPSAPEAGGGVLIHAGDIGAGDGDAPGRWPFQPGRHHQERGFARARRARQGNGFAHWDGQGDVRQDIDRAGAAAQGQADILQIDRW